MRESWEEKLQLFYIFRVSFRNRALPIWMLLIRWRFVTMRLKEVPLDEWLINNGLGDSGECSRAFGFSLLNMWTLMFSRVFRKPLSMDTLEFS